MKHFLLTLSVVAVLSMGVFVNVAGADYSGLHVTCGDQNSSTRLSESGHCTEGMVTFRGSSFPLNVGVTVLSYPAGNPIDSAVYATSEGGLTFTQTLVPAGGYMVVISADDTSGEVLTSMTVYVDNLH